LKSNVGKFGCEKQRNGDKIAAEGTMQSFDIGDFTDRVSRVLAPELGVNQWKLVADEHIFQGEFMEYKGRIFRSHPEFQRYQQRYNSNKTLQLGERNPPLFIVASETSLCGALNHCCDCEAPIEIQVDQEHRHRAFLVAKIDIVPGTELRFDYGYRYEEEVDGGDITMQWMKQWYCPFCNPRPIVGVVQPEVIDLTND